MKRVVVFAFVLIVVHCWAAAPMTNEDVVRMTMKGMPVEKIIDAIHSAPSTAFDLEPDVVQELIEAGVQAPVIEAMRRVTAPASPSPKEAPAVPARVPLTLHLMKPGKSADQPPVEGPPRVEVPARLPEGKAIRAAFFLMCTDPRHVPDGWTASPLAEGFPRHHLLWLADRLVADGGATGGEAEKQSGGKSPGEGGPRVLTLDLPPTVTVSIEAGRHPIVLGLALKPGDEPWVTAGIAEGFLSLTEATPVTLTVVVSGRLMGRRTRSSGYSVRIEGSEPAGAFTTSPPAESEP